MAGRIGDSTIKKAETERRLAGASAKTARPAGGEPQAEGAPPREARSAVHDREARSAAVHDREARSAAVNDRPMEPDGRARAQALVLIELRHPTLCQRAVPEGGAPALVRLIQAAQGSARVKQVGLLCAARDEGPELRALCAQHGVALLSGIAPDALSLLSWGLRELGAEPDQIVVRVGTGNVLVVPEVIDAAVETLLQGGHEYVSTDLGSGVLPAGLDVEAIYARLLYDLDATAEGDSERDLLTLPLHWSGGRASGRSGVGGARRVRLHELSPMELGPALERSGRYYASFRLGLEEARDLPLLRQVVMLLDRQPEPHGLHTLLRLLDQHPEWRQPGHHVLRGRRAAAG